KVASPEKSESVKALGQALMQEYLLPLEAMALLLTVALIGAALVALPASHQAPTSKGGNE
ncbi:MAG TPA: NADH-quinone oxidoreductase subunit J, partial [Verrucomicrobiales bacterium]|nr:NADH-quinone oxidoreductase subunit J [Verrucomicrobiales bacterium]